MATCIRSGCELGAAKGARLCGWHRLLGADHELQEAAAQRRLARAQARPGFVHRTRVGGLPAGTRWCSGCQSVVPLFYCSGSRCMACERRARRASHVERTYEISSAEERALLEWQGGRCFVCGRRFARRQPAVDHDHETNAVRGLLCSDEKFGCNVTLRRLLGDLEAARRLVAYVEMTPLERMRAGEPAWQWQPARDDGAPPF